MFALLKAKVYSYRLRLSLDRLNRTIERVNKALRKEQ